MRSRIWITGAKVLSHSVMSDSSRPHGLWPTRLLRPWNFPGKNTGMGCISSSILFQRIFLTRGSNWHLLGLLHQQAVFTTGPPGKPGPCHERRPKPRQCFREETILTPCWICFFYFNLSFLLLLFMKRILSTHNGLPQGTLPLCLNIKPKCLCSGPCPPVDAGRKKLTQHLPKAGLPRWC